MQLSKICQYELTLRWLPSSCKTFNIVAICCQRIFSQMLHKDCLVHLFQFMHVLHDATKNQQHLEELFHKPICPSSWTNNVQECLFEKQSFQIQLMVAIFLLRWSPTNDYHVGKIPSSSSMYENYCHSTSQYFKH